jgi:predicted nucleotidyltransferase
LTTFEQREVTLREWDSVVYELRKFVQLLRNCNPNVMNLLWLDPKHYINIEPLGQKLIDSRNLFVSKKIYYSFTGYAHSQLYKMNHNAFKGYMGDKRKKLVEKFGYDTKNGAHLIRLLKMGIEFLNEGTLHVFRKDAQELIKIKQGYYTLDQIKVIATNLFKEAEEAYNKSTIPDRPDKEAIESLLIEMLKEHFELHH